MCHYWPRRVYLHVPSPGLLRMFLQEGARRFIFEGRECGGHVGPRTSFVLWETMVGVLLEHLARRRRAADAATSLFAGGIHDALSAAMVAAMAAPLAERGRQGRRAAGHRVPVHRGGGRAPARSRPASSRRRWPASDTVLLETGPATPSAASPSPFVDDFAAEKRRLRRGGLPPRGDAAPPRGARTSAGCAIASKGVDRHPRPRAGPGRAEAGRGRPPRTSGRAGCT